MANRSYRSIDLGFGSGLTPAVKNLIIINVAAFVLKILAEAAGYGGYVRLGMLVPYAVTHLFFIWQPVTYLFLHEGFFHILFNMFALWMFGCELERNWGTRRFLNYYFLCGIGSALTVIAVSPFSLTATLGASGAIYGLLLAYGVLFPDRLIYIYMIIPIKAKYFVMIMGGIEFLSAVVTPGSLVSHVAHLGGIVFGFLYLKGTVGYYDLRNSYYRWRSHQRERAFRVYVNKQDRKDRERDPERDPERDRERDPGRDSEKRGPWIQ